MDEVLRFHADISSVENKLRELGKDLDRLGNKGGDVAGTIAKGFGAVATGIGKATGYVGAATSALRLYERGLSLASERLRDHMAEQTLATKQGAAWVESIKASTRQYIDDEELVQLALKATRGEMALNREQFELATRVAARAANEGGNYAEAIDAVTKGLRGQTKGLKEYGIQVSEVGTEQEKFNDLIRQLQGFAEEGAAVDPALQSIREQQAALRDALDDWKDTLVSFFLWFTEEVRGMIWAWKDLTGAADVEASQRKLEATQEWGREQQRRVNREAGTSDARFQAVSSRSEVTEVLEDGSIVYAFPDGTYQIITPEDQAAQTREARIRQKVGGGKGAGTGGPLGGAPKYALGYASAASESAHGVGTFADFMDYGAIGAAAGAAQSQNEIDSLMQGSFGGADSELAQIMSVPDPEIEKAQQLADIMLGLRDNTTAAGAAFQLFGSLMMGALDGAEEGWSSLAQSALRAGAAEAKRDAMIYGEKALGEGAQAIAHIATGDAAGAALHGLAAAKWLAAAASAAGVASALGAGAGAVGGGSGGGGGSASAGAPAGGWGAASRGGGGGDSISVTVNIGPGAVVAGDAHEFGDVVAQAVRDAKRRGGGADTTGKWG